MSEPEEQHTASVTQSESRGGAGGSFLSILSALTGGGQVTRTTPRPVPRPTQRPSTDIAGGIGSFFTQVLSEYLNGVEYQRRRRRSQLPTEIKRSIETDNDDFADAEDALDTQTPVKFLSDEESESAKAHTELIGVLQFPEESGEGRILHFKQLASEGARRGKRIVFEGNEHELSNEVYAPPQRGARVIFPDHYERYIRKGKILNRPTYAPSYDYQQQKEDRFVLSNEHRPSSYLREALMNYGEYMPTSNIRFNEIDYNYPNGNYISENRYSSNYQSSTRAPQHEDNKNIYVNNAQGVTEYYIRPDGHKVLLG
ncbi:CG13699 [Drosophila busckii]|uniref:CG13699 n=1 Tax=Drosophila busckii TaxID=30019 RepID=A0A0M4F1W1_DROBS|nr:CG13699 [Drosophila busckii]